MSSPKHMAVNRRLPIRGQARIDRDLRIVELLKEGKTRKEVAALLDTHIENVKKIAVNNGLGKNSPRVGRKNAADGRVTKDQLAYCLRELGPDVVNEIGANDIEGAELPRLYAALRVVLLDGEALIPRVQRVLEVQRRIALDTAADSRGAG